MVWGQNLCVRHILPAGKPLSKPTNPTASAPAGGPAGQGQGAGARWRLPDILARPDEFRRVLGREVLSGKQVVMAGVVMLEAPVDAVRLQVSSSSWHQRWCQVECSDADSTELIRRCGVCAVHALAVPTPAFIPCGCAAGVPGTF